MPRDSDRLVDFLTDELWPFHGAGVMSPDDVGALEADGPDVDSYWIVADDQTVGLIRLLDLGDIGRGAPRFDLRIAGRHRQSGHGPLATRWAVDHLFGSYPESHRIEADTRHDNVAMQRCLTAAGFTLEGRLRSSWPSDDGTWFDTMVYGLLRTDRTE